MIQKIVTMLKNIGTDRHDSAAPTARPAADVPLEPPAFDFAASAAAIQSAADKVDMARHDYLAVCMESVVAAVREMCPSARYVDAYRDEDGRLAYFGLAALDFQPVTSDQMNPGASELKDSLDWLLRRVSAQDVEYAELLRHGIRRGFLDLESAERFTNDQLR